MTTILLWLSSVLSTASALTTPPKVTVERATFRSYDTPYLACGPLGKTSVVLIHGFGSGARQWRALLPKIAASGRRAYALNLLGLGDAEKPLDAEYAVDLWAEQVRAFVAEKELSEEKVVFVGNSLGSLIALRAADAGQPCGLYNCAVGMNSKALPRTFREALRFPALWMAQPVFALVDVLLKNDRLAALLFDRVRSRENVANVLANVYRNQSRVDDDLLDLFLAPADMPGAQEAFVKIFTGDPGPRPEDCATGLSTIGVFWGKDDLVTPLDGPVGTFFRQRAADAADPARNPFTVFDDCGHCPFDDQPDLAGAALLAWLASLDDEEQRS
mmetsp:Transcript_257/g.763  ORF Transcript_257/g.763 Transcript_257/m.763 type:complete len:330 (-) Transcript_257:948-1937(-)